MQKRVEKLLLHAFFTTHAALAVRAQAQSEPMSGSRVDRRPVLLSPSPATPHLHPRERCLPCSQASAVVRRCDANSTTGLEYHIELTQRRATGELQGVPLVRRPLRAQRAVGSPAPSPAPARPRSSPSPAPFPSLEPAARIVTPPSPSVHRLCTAPGRTRRGLGVWTTSWRLQIFPQRAAHA